MEKIKVEYLIHLLQMFPKGRELSQKEFESLFETCIDRQDFDEIHNYFSIKRKED